MDRPSRPLVMGILNLTDDSFCRDGTLDAQEAVRQAQHLAAAGADIIDVGAESARTNRPPITPAEEVRRIERFRKALSENPIAAPPRFSDQVFPPKLSVNTWRSEVIESVLPLGWDILNDMSGLSDPRHAAWCIEHHAALVIMHTTAPPKVPQTHRRYDDVLSTVEHFFREKIALARSAGLAPPDIILDPGIDFAKSGEDNLRLLAHWQRFSQLGHPLLLALSRKTIIGRVLGLEDPAQRDAGTVACLVAAQRQGASVLRVHNVRAAANSARVISALEPCPPR